MIFIYFLESENPKGWMAKVETRGLISKVRYRKAHKSHNTQHLSLASLYTFILFAMDYVYLFSLPPPSPLSQNSHILKNLKKEKIATLTPNR
jgi:hypothetical protein